MCCDRVCLRLPKAVIRPSFKRTNTWAVQICVRRCALSHRQTFRVFADLSLTACFLAWLWNTQSVTQWKHRYLRVTRLSRLLMHQRKPIGLILPGAMNWRRTRDRAPLGQQQATPLPTSSVRNNRTVANERDHFVLSRGEACW